MKKNKFNWLCLILLFFVATFFASPISAQSYEEKAIAPVTTTVEKRELKKGKIEIYLLSDMKANINDCLFFAVTNKEVKNWEDENDKSYKILASRMLEYSSDDIYEGYGGFLSFELSEKSTVYIYAENACDIAIQYRMRIVYAKN